MHQLDARLHERDKYRAAAGELGTSQHSRWGSGVEIRQEGADVFKLRDGKVVRLEIFADRGKALESVGGRAPQGATARGLSAEDGDTLAIAPPTGYCWFMSPRSRFVSMMALSPGPLGVL